MLAWGIAPGIRLPSEPSADSARSVLRRFLNRTTRSESRSSALTLFWAFARILGRCPRLTLNAAPSALARSCPPLDGFAAGELRFKRYWDRDCAAARWPSTHCPKVVRPKSNTRKRPRAAQFASPGHCLAQTEGRIGWSARLRVADETDRSKSSTRNKNETNTNLIQHDQRHRSVSVDGWVRHHSDLSTGQSEHARSRRL